MISKALEEYLKTIYIIKKQNDGVRVTDIANRMECTKPSVNKAINNLKNNLNLKIEEFYTIDGTGESIILLAPQNAEELKKFEKIIFLDGVVKNFISKLNVICDAEIFVLENTKYKFPEVVTDREIFEKCFKQLKLVESNNYYNFQDLYVSNVENFNNISFAQFLFCVKVFEELEFININYTDTRIIVKFNRNVKKQLNESFIYRRANYILESRKTEIKED